MVSRVMNWWLGLPPQRRKRWILFVVAAIVVGWIFWRTRSVLAPYFVGLSLAYILAPFVEWIQRGLEWLSQHWKFGFLKGPSRALGILITYLALIALLVGFSASVIPLVTEQAESLWNARYNIWDAISRFSESALAQYQLLPEELRQQAEENFGRLNELVTRTLQQALQGTVVAITYTASLVLGIFIVPFWTFYLLKDFTQLRASLMQTVPGAVREDLAQIIRLLDTTLGAYLRGQIFLGFLIGAVTTVLYTIVGLNFALLLGMISGVLELIPNIGPTVAAVLSVLVALAQDPGKALWVAIIAFAIQQVENLFLTPRVLGRSVGLHPVLVMVVLVIGSEIAGVPGLFLAPVATALLRDLFKYFYYRFEENPRPPKEALEMVWGGDQFSMEL